MQKRFAAILLLGCVFIGLTTRAEELPGPSPVYVPRASARGSASVSQAFVSTLSKDDARILKAGPISTGRHLGGGLLGTFVGFGLGHTAQKRYASSKAWIFTAGEAVSLPVMLVSLLGCSIEDDMSRPNSAYSSYRDSKRSSCDTDTLYQVSLFAFFGLKIWETVDVWTGVAGHNDRYHELRRMESVASASFFVAPVAQNGSPGATAGVQLRF